MRCRSRKNHHNACCGQRHHHRKGYRHQGHAGCKQGNHAPRQPLTKEEKTTQLKTYLQDLQAEAQTVQAHIAALQEA